MENAKMPFINEESMRTQRVEIYLADLKERLSILRQQHSTVIKNSVDIIKEIKDVSSTMRVPNIDDKGGFPKIKKLIEEFEKPKKMTQTIKPNKPQMETNVDIQKILQNFEKLNESHVLKESLVLFKRAKESFEKIDTFLGDKNAIANVAHTRDGNGACRSASPKTAKFSKETGANAARVCDDDVDRYVSCSSIASVDTFQSATDVDSNHLTRPLKTMSSFERGYEGDNDDSEYDLINRKD